MLLVNARNCLYLVNRQARKFRSCMKEITDGIHGEADFRSETKQNPYSASNTSLCYRVTRILC